MAKKINFGGLSKQYNDSVATKDAFSSAGSTASRIFNTKVFGDTPFLKMEKDKTYRIRFVPYIVDKDHPKVQQGRLDEGDAAYVFDYTHHVIGPNMTRASSTSSLSLTSCSRRNCWLSSRRATTRERSTASLISASVLPRAEVSLSRSWSKRTSSTVSPSTATRSR